MAHFFFFFFFFLFFLSVQIRSAISDLDGMQPLVELLKDSDEQLKCLAAETIAHCAKNGNYVFS